MSAASSLHGLVALGILTLLLFVDEAGLPLPLMPSELLLISGGVLVSAHEVPLLVFALCAYTAMTTGMMVGYTWSRAVGQGGVRRLAAMVHATRAYDVAVRKVGDASVWHLFVCRTLPGLRGYTTLVAGAARVPSRRFAAAGAPAIAVWMGTFLGLGVLVGAPAGAAFHHYEGSLFRAALLVACGAGGYIGLSALTTRLRGAEPPLSMLPRPVGILVGAGIDLAAAGCVGMAASSIVAALTHARGESLLLASVSLGGSGLVADGLLRLFSWRSAGEKLVGIAYRGGRAPLLGGADGAEGNAAA